MANWDESEHPRHPAGAPDGRGGEFRHHVANWVEVVAGRMRPGAGISWGELTPWEEATRDYGDAHDSGRLLDLGDGLKLEWHAFPEQGTGQVGVSTDDDKLYVGIYDTSPTGLRNTARLLFWAPDLPDLGEFEDEEQTDPDGLVVRITLPGGETVGLLPGGGVRWIPPGHGAVGLHNPPIDFDTSYKAYELARELNDAADKLEDILDNYEPEEDE